MRAGLLERRSALALMLVTTLSARTRAEEPVLGLVGHKVVTGDFAIGS